MIEPPAYQFRANEQSVLRTAANPARHEFRPASLIGPINGPGNATVPLGFIPLDMKGLIARLQNCATLDGCRIVAGAAPGIPANPSVAA